MKTFRLTDAPVPFDPHVPRFGGQPEWLTKPMWPISRSTGRPMRFVCQVPLPRDFAGDQQVAYVFVTGGDEYVDHSWEPRGGENAVILQPGAFRAAVPTKAIEEGPVLQAVTHEGGRRLLDDVMLSAEIEEIEGEPERATSQYLGQPVWIQNDDTPRGGPWRLLMQIDSATDQYRLNFGDAGVAYVFVAADGTAARLLWQCY